MTSPQGRRPVDETQQMRWDQHVDAAVQANGHRRYPRLTRAEELVRAERLAQIDQDVRRFRHRAQDRFLIAMVALVVVAAIVAVLAR